MDLYSKLQELEDGVENLINQPIKTYSCSLQRNQHGVFMGKVNTTHLHFDFNHSLSRGFDVYYHDQDDFKNVSTRVKITDSRFRDALIRKAEDTAKKFKGDYRTGLGGDMLYIQMVYKNGYSFYKLGKSNNPQRRFEEMYRESDLDVVLFNTFDVGDQAFQIEKMYKNWAGRTYIQQDHQKVVPSGCTEFYHVIQYPMMVFDVLSKRLWFKGFERCKPLNDLSETIKQIKEFESSLEYRYGSRHFGETFKEASWKSALRVDLQGRITKDMEII